MVWVSLQENRTLQNGWIPIEAAFPQTVADDDRAMSWSPFIFREAAAQRRLHADDCKELVRHELRRNLLRLTGAGQSD